MRTRTFSKTALSSLLFLAWGFFLLGPTSGCGGGNPYKTVPVSGKVSFDDGSLIQAEEVTVWFHPEAAAVDAKTHPRDAMATVNLSDGTFASTTTYDPGDGLIPGKHKVAIQPMKGGAPVRGIVPDKYMDLGTTIIEIEVKPGMEPLNLTVPKK